MVTKRAGGIEGRPGRWSWLSLDYVPASSLLLLTRLCRMKGRRLRCHLRLGSNAPDASLRGILLGGRDPRDIREVLVMSGLTDDTNIERVMAYCEEAYPDDDEDRSRRPRSRHHPSGLA